jgi:hypothetical protein
MKKINNKHAQSLNNIINGAANVNGKAIESLVEASSAKLNSKREAVQKAFDSLSKSLFENEMEPSVVSSFKSTYGKNISLAEQVIENMAESQKESINLSIVFMNSLMQIISSNDFMDGKGAEKLAELIKNNLHKSTELSAGNMKKIISAYNDYFNYALTFNRNVTDALNDQMLNMLKLQHKNMSIFFSRNMIADWWKTK